MGVLLRRVGLGTGQTTHARSAGSPGADPPWLTPENVRSTFLFHSSREVGQSLRPFVQVWGQVLCGVVTHFQMSEDLESLA